VIRGDQKINRKWTMNLPETEIERNIQKKLEKKKEKIMRERKKKKKRRKNMTRKKNPSHPPSSFFSFPLSVAPITTYLNLLLPSISQISHHHHTHKPTIHNTLSSHSLSHHNSF
jgi:hypothetical protein